MGEFRTFREMVIVYFHHSGKLLRDRPCRVSCIKNIHVFCFTLLAKYRTTVIERKYHPKYSIPDLPECLCVCSIFHKKIIEIKPGNLNDLQCHSSIPNFPSNIGLQF